MWMTELQAGKGNPQARQIADEALGILASTLAPLAAERYLAAYGPTWSKLRDFESGGIGNRPSSLSDPQILLGRLQSGPEFDKTFGRVLVVAPGTVFTIAREIKDARNILYHRTKAWEAADGWRLADRVAGLLSAFDLLSGTARDGLEALATEAATVVAGDRSVELEELRREYVESVMARSTHVDAGGISPHLGSRIVRVRLEDVYIEPTLLKGDDVDREPHNLEDLRLTQRAIILGGPGAGKSALLRRLARTLALGRDSPAPTSTPILLTATDLAAAVELEPGMSLRRFLLQRHSERFGALFGAELELGRAVVFIDGIDEITDEELRLRVSSVVGAFTHEYPRIGLHATSRIVGYRTPAAWASFTEFLIEPFDDDQIAAFVGGWLTLLADESEDVPEGSLVEDINASPGARELAATPLLLTILVLLWHRGARLPQRLVELYDLATMTLLRDWPARRLGRSFDDRRMLDLLMPVALNLMAAGSPTISEGALVDRWATIIEQEDRLDSLAQARDKARSLLRMIAEHTGFFVEVGREAAEPQFGFLHRSFAEYLAARALAESWDAGGLELGAYLHAEPWRHVVDLFAGHVGQRGQAASTRLAESMLEAQPPYERYLRRNVPLLVRLMSEGLLVRPTLRDEIVRRGVEQVLDPALEPFRGWRGPSLARLAGRLANALTDMQTTVTPDDSSALRSRKRWLRLLISPASADRLAEFIASANEFAETAFEGEVDLTTAMRAVGLEMVDTAVDEGQYVWIAGTWFIASDEVTHRLSEAGVRSRSVKEIAAAHVARQPESEPWSIDAASYDHATIEEIVCLLSDHEMYWPVFYKVIDDFDWQEARVEQINGLVYALDRLPDDLGHYALEAFHTLDGGEARNSWSVVLTATILVGTTRQRQLALVRYLTASYGSSLGAGDMIANAVDEDPVSFRAMAIALGMQGAGAEPILVSMAEDLLEGDADPIAKGLARRALAVTTRSDEPLKVLSSPDVAIPADAIFESWFDTTGDVVTLLLRRADSADDRAAAAAIARAIIEVGTFHAYDLGGGELIANDEFDRLARELATAERAEQRKWSASLLAALDRPPAPVELAALLSDGDEEVRSLAADAIQDVDLADHRWLEDALLLTFTLETGPEIEPIVVAIGNLVDPAAIEDLTLLAQTFLEDHPGNPGALLLLESASSRQTSAIA